MPLTNNNNTCYVNCFLYLVLSTDMRDLFIPHASCRDELLQSIATFRTILSADTRTTRLSYTDLEVLIHAVKRVIHEHIPKTQHHADPRLLIEQILKRLDLDPKGSAAIRDKLGILSKPTTGCTTCDASAPVMICYVRICRSLYIKHGFPACLEQDFFGHIHTTSCQNDCSGLSLTPQGGNLLFFFDNLSPTDTGKVSLMPRCFTWKAITYELISKLSRKLPKIPQETMCTLNSSRLQAFGIWTTTQ